MNEYSQGIMGDGATVLKNGQPLTIEEIIAELNTLNEVGFYALHYRDDTAQYQVAKSDWDRLNK